MFSTGLWLLRFLKTVGHQRNRGIVGALVARESCPLTPTEVRQLLTTLQRLAETGRCLITRSSFLVLGLHTHM